jgi:hypothetical protein
MAMDDVKPDSRRVVTDPDLPVFRAISSLLTGFSETDLEGTGMLDEYYRVLMKEEDHEGVRAFLIKAEEIVKLGPGAQAKAAIQQAFIDLPETASQPNPPFDEMSYQGLAQRIILLWYTGNWTTMNWKDTRSQQDRTAIVSARAYQEGLIWVTAETHPAGAKQPGFGSWSKPPV